MARPIGREVKERRTPKREGDDEAAQRERACSNMVADLALSFNSHKSPTRNVRLSVVGQGEAQCSFDGDKAHEVPVDKTGLASVKKVMAKGLEEKRGRFLDAIRAMTQGPGDKRMTGGGPAKVEVGGNHP